MDPIQIVIIVVTLALTILFIVLGIQVWYIFKEVRSSIQKMNKMLDDMGKVTGTVGEGVSHLGGIVSGLKAGLSVFSSLRKRGDDE